MELSSNICTFCWKGMYQDEICSHCGKKKTEASEQNPDALEVLDKLHDRYYVGSLLGKGGFGITYSAWDDQQKRRVALKELFPAKMVYRDKDRRKIRSNEGQDAFFEELKQKFQQEADMLMVLENDSCAIRIYDFFRENGTAYYVMEFLEGSDLNVYRKEIWEEQKSHLTWEFLAPILRELLLTLKILHKKNVIHRDITPDNIFMTKDRKIHLIDFGSARMFEGNKDFSIALKPAFAPIEQNQRNGKQGPYTDLYSLSVSVYLLLSGKLPPKAEERRAGKQTIPIKQHCPGLPEYVAKAIEKGMSVEIKDRFQNAEEYLQALGWGTEPVTFSNTKKPLEGSGLGTKTEMPPKVHLQEKRNAVFWIYGIGGLYAGKRMPLTPQKIVSMGRWKTNHIVFPEGTRAVSRFQCEVLVNNSGDILVRDSGSTYGTFLGNIRLGKQWVRVKSGDRISFGNEVFQFFYGNV